MTTPFQRITFNSVYLGDHAYASFSYQGNVVTRIIPRARGARLYDTNEMGGGLITISISAWVVRDTRKELEQYFYNLQGNLGRTKATLDIDGWEIENAAIENYEMTNSENHSHSMFTVTITKPIE